jgi:phosphohistidine phosphatase
MKLYLVQHANAKSKEEDPDRPLSDMGWEDIRRVAGFLDEHVAPDVKRIYHSGKTRARQTAEVLGKSLNPQEGVHKAEGLDPLADPEIWAERLAAEATDLMLVGHLPYMSRIASLLLVGDPEKEIVTFQQGGVVCLARGGEWKAWSLQWMVIPAILEGFQLASHPA